MGASDGEVAGVADMDGELVSASESVPVDIIVCVGVSDDESKGVPDVDADGVSAGEAVQVDITDCDIEGGAVAEGNWVVVKLFASLAVRFEEMVCCHDRVTDWGLLAVPCFVVVTLEETEVGELTVTERR